MGKRPERPRDYTREKAAFAQSEYANRQTQATTYNNAINGYNTGLGNINSQLSKLGDTIRGSTIVQDENWGGYRNQLQGLETQLNGLNNGLSQYANAPDWASTVNSAYGAVDVGRPDLVAKNTGLATGFSGQLSELRGLLSNLEAQRKAEEGRIDQYASQMGSQLAGLGSQIGGYGIADIGGIQSSQGALASALSGLKSFSSSILGEYRPSTVQGFMSQIGSYEKQLNDLMAQRTAEQNRIKAFQTGLGSTYDQLNTQFGGLNLSNIDQMNALQRQIDAQQLNASRFSSALNPNFGTELSAYSDLESRLGSLFQERAAEQARVDAAKNAANSGMGNILSQLGQADIYNSGQLNQIGLAISQGQKDINSFSSLLSPDFSGISTQLTDASTQLKQLRDQRLAALQGFGTNAANLNTQIGGYDLANESGLRSGLTSAQQLLSQLGQFTGTDVAQYRDQVQGAVNAAQGRLTDLGNERNNIETSARTLLNNSKTRGYYTTADIDALAAELSGITGRQGTYNATQAQDEVDAITGIIGTERTRFKTEAAAAEAAQKAEYEEWLKSQGPKGGGFGNAPSYAAWLANWKNNPNAFLDLPSSFARQLQVQYV